MPVHCARLQAVAWALPRPTTGTSGYANEGFYSRATQLFPLCPWTLITVFPPVRKVSP